MLIIRFEGLTVREQVALKVGENESSGQKLYILCLVASVLFWIGACAASADYVFLSVPAGLQISRSWNSNAGSAKFLFWNDLRTRLQKTMRKLWNR